MSKIKKLLKNRWIWGFLLGIAVVHVVRPYMRRIPEPPPITGTMPGFSLTDQNGEQFTKDELDGRTYILNLFHRNCSEKCQNLMKGMKRIHNLYKRDKIDILLISISTDFVNDNPDNLKAYGANLGIDFSSWYLLSGKNDEIEKIITKVFQGHLSEQEVCHSEQNEETGRDCFASLAMTKGIAMTKIAIIDAAGNVRGLYNSDELGLDEIFHRSQHVLKENQK